ncbi:hypothetical protein GCM10025786_10260 [Nocardioides caeni]
MWLGLLLVAGSIVLGARVLAAADDTVAVWSLGDDRGAGSTVEPADLMVERVRFADAASLDRYFPADEPVPSGLVLTRAVGAGELLARSAVGPADAGPTLQVPLEVDPNRVPPAVDAGSVVDVWVSDAAATGEPRADGAAGIADTPVTGPALSEVTVVAAPSYDDTFAVTGARQLVVVVDDERAAAFEQLLASLDDPVIRILQRA